MLPHYGGGWYCLILLGLEVMEWMMAPSIHPSINQLIIAAPMSCSCNLADALLLLVSIYIVDGAALRWQWLHCFVVAWAGCGGMDEGNPIPLSTSQYPRLPCRVLIIWADAPLLSISIYMTDGAAIWWWCFTFPPASSHPLQSSLMSLGVGGHWQCVVISTADLGL